MLSYCSGKEGELNQDEDYILSNPYHLVTHLSWCILELFTTRYIAYNNLRKTFHFDDHLVFPLFKQVDFASEIYTCSPKMSLRIIKCYDPNLCNPLHGHDFLFFGLLAWSYFSCHYLIFKVGSQYLLWYTSTRACGMFFNEILSYWSVSMQL